MSVSKLSRSAANIACGAGSTKGGISASVALAGYPPGVAATLRGAILETDAIFGQDERRAQHCGSTLIAAALVGGGDGTSDASDAGGPQADDQEASSCGEEDRAQEICYTARLKSSMSGKHSARHATS